MTSESNVAIWRSLIKQYGVPKLGTPAYEVKERAYRQAVVDATNMPPPPVVIASQRPTGYICECCGHTAIGIPHPRFNKPEYHCDVSGIRGRPVYTDDEGEVYNEESYNRDMDRMITEQMERKRPSRRSRVVVSDTESDSGTSSDEFESKPIPEPKPVKVKAKAKKVEKKSTSKKSVSVIKKDIPATKKKSTVSHK